MHNQNLCKSLLRYKTLLSSRKMNGARKAETQKTFGFIRLSCTFIFTYLTCSYHPCIESTISVSSAWLLSQSSYLILYNTLDYKNISVECRDSHCQWWWRLPSRSGTSSRPKKGWKKFQKVITVECHYFYSFWLIKITINSHCVYNIFTVGVLI